MPLRLNLKPYEQVMINGAVITNLKRRSFLAIHNQAQILPGKFVMQAERASTPVRRCYFAAQMAYIFAEVPDEFGPWAVQFRGRFGELLGVVQNTEVRAKLEAAGVYFEARQFFQCLRTLQDVIDYEVSLFAIAGQDPGPAFGDGINHAAAEAEADDDGRATRPMREESES